MHANEQRGGKYLASGAEAGWLQGVLGERQSQIIILPSSKGAPSRRLHAKAHFRETLRASEKHKRAKQVSQVAAVAVNRLGSFTACPQQVRLQQQRVAGAARAADSLGQVGKRFSK